MKKLILSITFLSTIGSYAQMSVVDAGANKTMGSQLTTATKQLAQAEKSYAMLEKASEKVEKVSSAIKSVNEIGGFLKMQNEILSNVKIVLGAKNKRVSTKKIDALLNSTTTSISNVRKLLSNSFFSLNDKERLDLLQAEKKTIAVELLRSRMYAKSVQ